MFGLALLVIGLVVALGLIAKAERTSLRETLANAVSARYGNDGGQQVDIQSATVVLKSIQEAYPNISDALFKQLMTNAVGCRNETAGSFQKLQKFAGDFLTWAQTGGTFERNIRNNFPTDNLKVKGVGGEALTGMAALEHLVEPILTADAAQAVQTHQMPEQQLFPSPTK